MSPRIPVLTMLLPGSWQLQHGSTGLRFEPLTGVMKGNWIIISKKSSVNYKHLKWSGSLRLSLIWHSSPPLVIIIACSISHSDLLRVDRESQPWYLSPVRDYCMISKETTLGRSRNLIICSLKNCWRQEVPGISGKPTANIIDFQVQHALTCRQTLAAS